MRYKTNKNFNSPNYANKVSYDVSGDIIKSVLFDVNLTYQVNQTEPGAPVVTYDNDLQTTTTPGTKTWYDARVVITPKNSSTIIGGLGASSSNQNFNLSIDGLIINVIAPSDNNQTTAVTITANDSLSRTVNVYNNLSTASSITKVYRSGNYVARHATDAVLNRVAGKNLSTHGKIFTDTTWLTRNTNVWCNDIDLTAISPWNSNATNRKAGVAVTPRHIIWAAHYSIPNGTTVRFITTDNQVVERTIISQKRHPDYAPYYPDLVIGTLSSDLPGTITPVKVLPANFSSNYATVYGDMVGIPALCLDQEEKALVTPLRQMTDTMATFGPDEYNTGFYESKISGDSGNPSFLIIDNELVLITVWTYGGTGSGTNISKHITKINQMIVDSDTLGGVSTGYTLTPKDLSSFISF